MTQGREGPGRVSSEREGSLALLTLQRPDKLNAITPAMTAALHRALDAAEADTEVRAIVVVGDGRACDVDAKALEREPRADVAVDSQLGRSGSLALA